MKYISLIFLLSISLFAKNEGPILYASCKFCHGFKAEVKYDNQVPSLKSLDYDVLKTKLELYKKGQINRYGYGLIMQQQMKNIPNDKIPILAKYIKSL